MQVGDALLEITMVCDPCQRMDELGPAAMEIDGKRGMLAHVVVEGEIALGDSIELLPSVSRSAAAATKTMSSSPRVRPEVEPAVERLDFEPSPVSSRCHSGADGQCNPRSS